MKPEETIDFHIRWVWAKISRLYNSEAAIRGGTMSIGYILLNIDKNGTPSTSLGPKMGMESRSLSRSLKMMEDEGLIVRKSDAKDRRIARVFLTDKGIEMRDISKQVVIRFNEFIQSEIPQKDLEVTFNTLQKISTIIEQNKIFEPKEHEAKH